MVSGNHGDRELFNHVEGEDVAHNKSDQAPMAVLVNDHVRIGYLEGSKTTYQNKHIEENEKPAVFKIFGRTAGRTRITIHLIDSLAQYPAAGKLFGGRINVQVFSFKTFIIIRAIRRMRKVNI